MAEVLAILGLAIDILGAALLAIPDIPLVRSKLWPGKIENAVAKLEGGGIRPGERGYDFIKTTLENLYGIEIEDEIEGIRVGGQTLSRNPTYKAYIYRTDDDSYAPEEDLSWNYVRSTMLARARLSETRIRLVGFALLIVGFSLQLLSLFVS